MTFHIPWARKGSQARMHACQTGGFLHGHAPCPFPAFLNHCPSMEWTGTHPSGEKTTLSNSFQVVQGEKGRGTQGGVAGGSVWYSPGRASACMPSEEPPGDLACLLYPHFLHFATHLLPHSVSFNTCMHVRASMALLCPHTTRLALPLQW